MDWAIRNARASKRPPCRVSALNRRMKFVCRPSRWSVRRPSSWPASQCVLFLNKKNTAINSFILRAVCNYYSLFGAGLYSFYQSIQSFNDSLTSRIACSFFDLRHQTSFLGCWWLNFAHEIRRFICHSNLSGVGPRSKILMVFFSGIFRFRWIFAVVAVVVVAGRVRPVVGRADARTLAPARAVETQRTLACQSLMIPAAQKKKPVPGNLRIRSDGQSARPRPSSSHPSSTNSDQLT